MAALTAGMNRPGATADLGPGGPPAARTTGPAEADQSAAVSSGARTVRSWALLVLAAPAAAEVWSAWVGIARLTGFGLVSPLPGIWPSLHLDTSITLPIGVEAYAAYALRAWLSGEHAISGRTRRFAKDSNGPAAGPPPRPEDRGTGSGRDRPGTPDRQQARSSGKARITAGLAQRGDQGFQRGPECPGARDQRRTGWHQSRRAGNWRRCRVI
jgi:hypothetical protein